MTAARAMIPPQAGAEAEAEAETDAAAMRVLVMAHNHPALFPGGAESMAYRLFRHFREREGMSAAFVAATDPAHSPAYCGAPLTAHDGHDGELLLQAGPFDYFTQTLRHPGVLTEHFAPYLQETRPDIVHLHHTLRLGMEALAVIRRALPAAKIVYTLHDFIPICHRDGQMVSRADGSLCDAASTERCHRCFQEISVARFRLREQLVRTHLDLVDAFVSPSRFLAERYLAWGLPEEKMHVIPNGMEAEGAAPAPQRALSSRAPRRRFAYFGQITPYKGLTLLCEAARMLRERGERAFHIDIHGHAGEQEEAFQARFKESLERAQGCVTWHGRYRPEDLPRLMAEADWVVVPSTWWENAPLVIDEALFHRRPVICSGIGGMAEKISHRENGLHFTAGSAESLASALREAMESPDLWHRLVRGIAPPATLRECAGAHAALYRGLARPNSLMGKKNPLSRLRESRESGSSGGARRDAVRVSP